MNQNHTILSHTANLALSIVFGLVTALLLVLLLPGTGLADSKGTGAGGMARSGFGARALGMGGAYVAVANDYSAPYWNPAGVTRGYSIYLGGARYDKYGLGLNLNYLTGGLSFGKESSTDNSPLPPLNLPMIERFSFAATYLGFSTELQSLEAVEVETPLTYGEKSFMATGGVILPVVGSFGLTGKNYSFTASDTGVSGEDASAGGLGFDLGYLVNPLEGFTLGVAAFDLSGTTISWENTLTEPEDVVPPRYSVGSAYEVNFNRSPIPESISGELLISGQYGFGSGVVDKLRAGMEYSFSIFSLRAGAIKPSGDEAYFTAGAGLDLEFIKGDLAWVQNRTLEGENATDTIVFSTEFQF